MSFELIVPGVLAMVAGIATYVIQKRIDRRELTRERHFSIYVEVVEALCELANAHNRGGVGKEEALSRYSSAKMKFAIVASDDAMSKFVTFDERITSGKEVPSKEFDDLLSEFLKAIRCENLGRTRVSGRDLVVITPYGKSLRDER